MPADPAHERRYQVFVSSTFVDLQEERRKVLEAILETQSFPAGMELFPSADDEQFEFIKREIESSDYYIVIVAGRYGSLAPDGLSFTEKEYDYALELKKPVMAFLHKDLGELKGKALESTEEQRKRLDAFRCKVSADKLGKFYTNPDELKTQVWQALNYAFRMKPQTGWVRASNARRIEDLEEIAGLQKKALELESEISRLKSSLWDPRHLLARGDDFVDVLISFAPISQHDGDQRSVDDAPPIADAIARVTWNDLLETIFRPAEHEVRLAVGSRRILELVLGVVASGHPNAARWVRRICDSGHTVGYNEAEFAQTVAQIVAHFLGLGYVSTRHTDSYNDPFRSSTTYWSLTREGFTHLAVLLSRRQHQSPLRASPHSS